MRHGVLGSRVNRGFSASSERQCLKGPVSSLRTGEKIGIAPHQIIERDEFSKPQRHAGRIVTGKARLSPPRRGRQS